MEEIKLSAASLRGSLHRETGAPCQDQTALLREGGVAAAALADGAGSMAHSHIGARAAAGAVAALLCRRFEELFPMAEGELGRQVLGTARAALAATGLPLEELGCTLLFYACGGGRFLAGHLGDGLMALVQGEDCRPLSLPENGENPSETWFVTSPDALEHLRLLRGDQGPGPGTVLLMSDGASGLLLEKRSLTLSPACRRLAQWAEEYSSGEMAEILEDNLREVLSQGTHDDLSIAILHWNKEEEPDD